MADVSQLRTVEQFSKESRGTFTVGSIRWLIFNAESNGLKPALVHIGRRVYIDRAMFNQWLEAQRKSA